MRSIPIAEPGAPLGRHGGDVVAVLPASERAIDVARRAVAEAVRLKGRIRFVQLVPTGGDEREVPDAERLTFRAAVRAMADTPGIPCTFEVVTSDPLPLLVERSHQSELLVVSDDSGADTRLALEVSHLAACSVLVLAAR